MDDYVPIFIDFEASSLGETSYPIEFGVCFENRESESFLIRPHSGWSDWNQSAQKIHGIKKLKNKYVVSDCAVNDIFWADRLFSAAGIKKEFDICSLNSILTSKQRKMWQSVAREVRINISSQRHRAENDAINHHETWKMVMHISDRHRF